MFGNYSLEKLVAIFTSIEETKNLRAEIAKYKYIPLVIIATFGNLLILIYFTRIYKYRIKHMSSYHFLIILLAVIDLVAVTYDAFTSILLKSSSIEIDVFAYSVIFGIRSSLFTASCWLLVLLSYERYRTIVHPFREKIRKRFIGVVCISGWLFCIVGYVLMYKKTTLTTNITIGGGTYFVMLLPSIIMLLLDCLAPSLCLLYFYKRIENYMKKTIARLTYSNSNSDNNDNNLSVNGNNSTMNISINNISNIGNSVVRNGQKTKDQGAVNTLRNLIIVYVFLVWPGRVVYIIIHTLTVFYYLLYIENFSFLNLMLEAFEIWIVLNNLANVFVYLVLIQKFREFLWEIVSCNC